MTPDTRARRTDRQRAHARRRLCGALPVAALVAACASPAPPMADPSPVVPDFWSGRFAVTWSENDYQPTEDRANGRFELLTRGDRSILDLTSPLGQTIARVTIDPLEATLVTGDGTRRSAASADALTEEVFGWRIPLADLPRWFSGQIAQPERFEGERPTAGTDNGWSVRFEAFSASGPRRLALQWPARPADADQATAMQATQASRRIELRLLIDRAAHLGEGGPP